MGEIKASLILKEHRRAEGYKFTGGIRNASADNEMSGRSGGVKNQIFLQVLKIIKLKQTTALALIPNQHPKMEAQSSP